MFNGEETWKKLLSVYIITIISSILLMIPEVFVKKVHITAFKNELLFW